MSGNRPNKSYLKGETKKQLPLITAVFLLSIFAGILLSFIIQQWLFSHVSIIEKIQAQEEELRLEQTLDQYSF